MQRQLSQLSQFLAGRWQIPLALVAVMLSGVALYKLMPKSDPQQIDAVFADIVHLARSGAYTDAADAAANLLHTEPPLPEAQRARLHNFLANLIYERQSQLQQPVRENVERLLEHHRSAVDLGYPQDAHSLMRLAAAREWLGEDEAAAFHYRQVLESDPRPASRRKALRKLIRFAKGQPQLKRERRQYLHELLEAGASDPATLWWALRESLADALDMGDAILAQQLLDRHGKRLRSSELKGHYEFLQAWILVHQGRNDEASPVIYWIEDWIEESAPRISYDDDDLGKLPALNQWLLGKLELAELRPQTALQSFNAVLNLHPSEDLWTAATVGKAQSLAMLERHDAALDAFTQVADRLDQGQQLSTNALREIRTGAWRLFEERYEREQFDTALGYLELAAKLADSTDDNTKLAIYERVGRVLDQAAAAAAEGHPHATDRSVRAYHHAAGQFFEKAVPLALELDDEHYHSLLWEAAQSYDAAGYVADARRMLEAFVTNAPDDPRIPQALLMYGQGYAVQGLYPEAVAMYRELVERFPKLEEAARAQVYMADCHMARGAEGFPEARRVLEGLLEGQFVEPQAPLFRDAFLRLSELLYHQEDYAAAISRMEAFQKLYPDDPETARVIYLSADTYRRSANALREAAAAEEYPGPQAAEAKRRYRLAANLYARFLKRISDRAKLDPRLAEYERLALFNRGDCLFELGERELLEEAVETYRTAAALYETEPAALAAQVQLANVHLRLGQVTEAARAVERGRWLLHNIPSDAFTGRYNASSRAEWDEYLTTVASSRLFRGVLNDRQ
jgi:tetratricopeptide (TPR) repeat protein